MAARFDSNAAWANDDDYRIIMKKTIGKLAGSSPSLLNQGQDEAVKSNSYACRRMRHAEVLSRNHPTCTISEQALSRLCA